MGKSRGVITNFRMTSKERAFFDRIAEEEGKPRSVILRRYLQLGVWNSSVASLPARIESLAQAAKEDYDDETTAAELADLAARLREDAADDT